MTITVNVTKSIYLDPPVWSVEAYFSDYQQIEGSASASSPHTREEDFAASPLFDELVAEAIGKARDKMVAAVRAERKLEESTP
jgi:hypothetical protein